MRRLQALARQLLAAPASTEKQKQPPSGGAGAPLGSLSPEAHASVLQTVQEWRESSDRLYSEGALPTMSIFDVRIATRHEMGVPSAEEVSAMLEQAEKGGGLSLLDRLPGPWQGATTAEAKVALCQELQIAQLKGTDVFLYSKWQLQYGDNGLGSNIVFPKILAVGAGTGTQLAIFPRVLVADAADAERISRVHVRKDCNFEPALYDSVISTTDNEHWRRQRQHLAEAFMPLSSLAKILPTSLARAKSCAERLALAAARGPVDMSDFLLHEAQAQLQLALLGAPEALAEATNEDIRATFMGDIAAERVGALGRAMRELMALARDDQTLALPSDGRPVRGPLSRAVQTSGMAASTDYGNMLLILFAGHDTTGHTMTWLLFELARHPELQRELHREVCSFFEHLAGRDPSYSDLGGGLELMDRCVTETLRLWPAVAAGTYRQLHFTDTVRGPGDSQVELPGGTYVQVANWSRHRNPALWGADVDEFNPRRQFAAEEVAHVGCPLAAVSPQSPRYSPFAFSPRNCLGRNFGQMEMRLIMLYLLKDFEFSLAAPYDSLIGVKTGSTPDEDDFRGVNRATMGPMDLERSSEHSWGRRPVYAMKMHVRRRA